MWIITNKAFVSIVQHRDDPALLIVRGRFKGDAARFLGYPVKMEEVTPAADYRFRIYAGREKVAERLLVAATEIRYPNFKDSIKEAWRKSVAMRLWAILNREQSDRHGPRTATGGVGRGLPF